MITDLVLRGPVRNIHCYLTVNIRTNAPFCPSLDPPGVDAHCLNNSSKLQQEYGNETLDRSTIRIWVQRFQKVDFNLHDKERPGKIKIAKHNIHTVPHPPIQLRPYRRSASEYDEIKRQVEDLKKKGLVRDSRSPWAFPVTLVPKADGQKRLCVDYRRLNALTIDDKMPLPNIQEVIDRLQGAKYFTSLDIASGYWHVEMAPDSTEKTAFITNEGLYEWMGRESFKLSSIDIFGLVGLSCSNLSNLF
ncbi:hypothetical protein LAZ67_5002962 [Cordylochernes scorpioides]|uniref:Reverse transcriptase domain-containing protein n=1 Tax=Cordylochernes scorpioides TaxID=51811 RepID=A0ABY6KJX6_9ARAC|nr:hypothetical protein LAZ67_5002962 [Cordylochernes scorpioides]